VAAAEPRSVGRREMMLRCTADLSDEAVRQLTRVGFWWSEQTPDLPHPRDYVDLKWNPTERQGVVHYLESAYHTPFVSCGWSWCRFGCQGWNGTRNLTDGTYLFPEGFVHYVRDHFVRPDEPFLDHVRALNLRMPELQLLPPYTREGVNHSKRVAPFEPAMQTRLSTWFRRFTNRSYQAVNPPARRPTSACS
jgi:hypothetical protein